MYQKDSTYSSQPYEPEVVRQLSHVYSSLREHFGYEPHWWPGRPLEIAFTAILVQQCDWTTAREAVDQLKRVGLLSLPKLAVADHHEVESCLARVRFRTKKRTRLISLAQAILRRGYATMEDYLAPSRDTALIRSDLLSLDGIGPETADCILLFASQLYALWSMNTSGGFSIGSGCSQDSSLGNSGHNPTIG